MSISYGGDFITDTDGGKLRPSSAVMRNRIINGAMVVNQRAFSGTPANGAYTLDRWQAQQSGGGTYTVTQSTSAPAGFINSLLVTVTSTDTSLGTSDYYIVNQNIEGLNITDLAWGTADAKTVTLSFWVRSSLTGTFGGSLMNDGYNRTYPFSYTISSADTWTQISITVAGDTTGTWLTTNGTGIRVEFGLGLGTNYVGTAGAWVASEKYTVTGAVSVIGTSGATWGITGVQLEVGSSATGFEYRQYGTELQLCQRYYYKANLNGTARLGSIYNSSLDRGVANFEFHATMRASPSLTYTIGNGTLNSEYISVEGAQIYMNLTTNCYLNTFAASAEL